MIKTTYKIMGKINLGNVELTPQSEVNTISGNVETVSGNVTSLSSTTTTHTADTTIHFTSGAVQTQIDNSITDELANYLPLSGGTMTGSLRVAAGLGISDSNGEGMIVAKPTTGNWSGISSSQWGVGNLTAQGVIRSSNAKLVHYIEGIGSYDILDASGGTISGALTVQEMEFGNLNEINSTASPYNLHLNYRKSGNVSICTGGGNCGVGTNNISYKLHVIGTIAGSSLSIVNGGRINVQSEPSAATMYIGNSNNAGWVRMQDICSAAGSTQGDASGWTIRTNGNAIFVSVQQTSDIRKKNIIENVNLSAKDIANAPIFKFTWLDPEMPEGVNVGTSAQYWQTVLPEIVSETDDKRTLSMQYGVAGLVSSVALAKKVVEQEETIKAQEARIKALEDAIANIQNMLNK